MAVLGHRGSFMGFTYNGIHSSTLGITRVSDGSRYNDGLIPSMKDVATDIVGTDGAVYFGTTYTKRVFSVSFVFYELTNDNLLCIQKAWCDQKIHDLIFDEAPYKVYSAKVTGTGTIKHICFTKDGEDYYNGEGSLQFTCMTPYARSRYPWREDYNEQNIPEWLDDDEFSAERVQRATENLQHEVSLMIEENNISSGEPSRYNNLNDWIAASRIPFRGDYGQYSSGSIIFYNAGDIAMPTKWSFNVPWRDSFSVTIQAAGYPAFAITNLYRNTAPSPTGAGGDTHLIIDMQNRIVQGYDEYGRPTGRLYTQYVSGSYFLLPQGECVVTTTQKPTKVTFNYLYI